MKLFLALTRMELWCFRSQLDRNNTILEHLEWKQQYAISNLKQCWFSSMRGIEPQS